MREPSSIVEFVVRTLRSEGQLTPERIIARTACETPARQLAQTGEIAVEALRLAGFKIVEV